MDNSHTIDAMTIHRGKGQRLTRSPRTRMLGVEMLEQRMMFANFPDGVDDRWAVPNTTDYPWSATGRLSVEFEDGGQDCSGALIGPFHFLTAAHCLAPGGFTPDFQSATVALGQNGQVTPFGVAQVTLARTVQPAHNNDWALLTLDRQIGYFSKWFDFGSPSFFDFLGMPVQTAGYPGDMPAQAPPNADIGETMYETDGVVFVANGNQIFHDLDLAAGQSGGPIWQIGTNPPRIVGVITREGTETHNVGTRITFLKEVYIQASIAVDTLTNLPANKPDLVDWDRWFRDNQTHLSCDTVKAGQAFGVTAYPWNTGTAVATSFDVEFRLSKDDRFDLTDPWLGQATISSLAPFTAAAAHLPVTFPGVIPGEYYIVWHINANAFASQVEEFDHDNNFGATQSTIRVVEDSEFPPPCDVVAPPPAPIFELPSDRITPNQGRRNRVRRSGSAEADGPGIRPSVAIASAQTGQTAVRSIDGRVDTDQLELAGEPSNPSTGRELFLRAVDAAFQPRLSHTSSIDLSDDSVVVDGRSEWHEGSWSLHTASHALSPAHWSSLARGPSRV